jgi:hypothetical protein
MNAFPDRITTSIKKTRRHLRARLEAHIVGVIYAVAASVALVTFQKDRSSSSRLTDALWNQLPVGGVVGALASWAAVETSRRSVTAHG